MRWCVVLDQQINVGGRGRAKTNSGRAGWNRWQVHVPGVVLVELVSLQATQAGRVQRELADFEYEMARAVVAVVVSNTQLCRHIAMTIDGCIRCDLEAGGCSAFTGDVAQRLQRRIESHWPATHRIKRQLDRNIGGALPEVFNRDLQCGGFTGIESPVARFIHGIRINHQ